MGIKSVAVHSDVDSNAVRIITFNNTTIELI